MSPTIQLLKEFKRIAKARADANNESFKLVKAYSSPYIYFRDTLWFELCRFHSVVESNLNYIFRVKPNQVESIYKRYRSNIDAESSHDTFISKAISIDGFDIIKLMREFENRIDIELYDNLIAIEEREPGAIRSAMNFIDRNLYDKFLLRINNSKGPLLNNVDKILVSNSVHEDDDTLREMLYDLSYLSLINKLQISEDQLEIHQFDIDISTSRISLHRLPNGISKILGIDEIHNDADLQIYSDLIGLGRCESTIAAITGWEEMSPMLIRPDIKVLIESDGKKWE